LGRRKNGTSYPRTAFVDAIILAIAIVTLNITLRRDWKVYPAKLPFNFYIKTGMFFVIYRDSHGSSSCEEMGKIGERGDKEDKEERGEYLNSFVLNF
jgi:hypothetical protein